MKNDQGAYMNSSEELKCIKCGYDLYALSRENSLPKISDKLKCPACATMNDYTSLISKKLQELSWRFI